MSRDPLEALLRLRRMAANEARRGLAECLRAEGEAAAAVATIEAAIDRETKRRPDSLRAMPRWKHLPPGCSGSGQSRGRR